MVFCIHVLCQFSRTYRAVPRVPRLNLKRTLVGVFRLYTTEGKAHSKDRLARTHSKGLALAHYHSHALHLMQCFRPTSCSSVIMVFVLSKLLEER